MDFRKLRILSRAAALILAAALCFIPAGAKKKRPAASASGRRSVEKVERDKQQTQRQISETSDKIKANSREINRQLGRLEELSGNIESGKASISRLNARIDTLSAQAAAARDSVTALEEELEQMRATYVRALRQLQPDYRSFSPWAFILSAGSFREAQQRVRYLRQYSRWRVSKADKIRRATDRIAERRSALAKMHAESDEALRQIGIKQKQMSRDHDEAQTLLAGLRKEDSALRRTLKEQKDRARRLDRELDRIIAEEQRKAAEKERAAARAAKEKKRQNSGTKPAQQPQKPAEPVRRNEPAPEYTAAEATSALTGSFAENKGRLLFPVSGKYRITRHFGRHPHPTLPNVETENSGIDIEVASGTAARAVFGGKVSAIFRQEGFNSIIMVRHGKYITIYAGLDNIAVRQGDTVKAGQNLGMITAGSENSGRAVLHFEIRNERQKLNPTQWVR